MASQRVTTIHLVRHAHAEWQPDEGRPLSARGRIGATAVTECLRGLPIAAIYASPARRAIETVEGLGALLELAPILLADLRERELPPAYVADFEAMVRTTWRDPAHALAGGESNLAAQERGLATLRTVLGQHRGQQVVVATHGTLMALILNGLDQAFGYEFWRALTFPDVYRLRFEEGKLNDVRRMLD